MYNGLKKQLRWFWFGCLVSFAGIAYGAELKPLYEVELPVQNEAGGFDQAALITQAFKEVLVQISGTNKILDNATIAAAFGKADKYVTQFSYHERPERVERLPSERSIKVLFNQNLLNQLCAAAKQPIWNKKRPVTLIWIVVEHDSTLSWLSNDSIPFTQAIEKAFNKRAIPFVLPLLDLTDTTTVSEQDVWNPTLEPVEAASKRYNPDFVLLGRLKNTGGWEGQWTLVQEGDSITFNTKADALNALANDTAENLSARLLPQILTDEVQADTVQDSNTTGKVTLTVFGIKDAEQYGKVLEYLRRLPSVNGVDVTQVISDKTVFDLQTTAPQAAIAQSISDGRFLIEHTTFNESTALAYTLVDAQ